MTDLMVMMVCWQRLVVGEPGPASSRALTKRYERRIVIVIIIVINGHHFHFGRCHQGSIIVANMEDLAVAAVSQEKLRVAIVVVKSHFILFKV